MGSIKISFTKDLDQFESRMRRMMDNLFGPGIHTQAAPSPRFEPAVDIYETPQEMVIRLELAGMRKEDFSITLNRQELIIRGCRRFLASDPVERFHRLEINYGKFEQRFHLPRSIEENNIQADYNNGILEVRLPWRPSAPAKRIAVKEE
jgi:HSP20 family protein